MKLIELNWKLAIVEFNQTGNAGFQYPSIFIVNYD